MASRGVNKVILLGNVGGDPDCRNMPSGDVVANFSLATSETWNDKHTGEQREKTEWHRCVAFRGLAGVVQQYVRKGSKLYVEGRLQTRKWQDQNGQDRYSTEILVDNMQMLDSRSGGSSNFDGGYQQQSTGGYGNSAPVQTQHQMPPQAPVTPQQPQSQNNYGTDPDAGMMGGFSDDDIPF